jgi:putative ABC transport system permease protein
VGTLLRRVWYLLRHRRLEADLAEEIEAHRAMAQSTLEADGAAPHEAAVSARRVLGNDLSARDRARDVWIWPWLQDVMQDVRFAGRLLVKDRWLAVTAILALALGGGVNGVMFAIFNAYGIAGVPIERADRVLFLSTRDTRAQSHGLSYADFEDLQRAAPWSLAALGAFSVGSVSLGDEGRAPDRYARAYMSASGFTLMRQRPILGRDFRDDDDRIGAAPTVILSSKVWHARYAGDPGILGRMILLNRVPTIVIGIMADGFQFPNRADVWQPLRLMSKLADEPRDQRALAAFARLADEATIAQAQAQLSTVGAQLAEAYPASNAGIQLVAQPINSQYNTDITHPAWAAFVSVGVLVLLVACANVANLLLARSVSRSREIAIRSSLGATRPRVVRQLLIESALLALLGSALGLAFAKAGLILWTSALPAIGIPYFGFVLDGFVLAIFALASFLTVFLFGLAPALTLSKTDVNRVLKDGGRGISGPASRRWTTTFLSAELGVMILLLLRLVSGNREAAEWRAIDARMDVAPLLTASLALPAERYATVESRRMFHEGLAERIAGVGEVSAFSVASALPMAGAASRQFEIERRPLPDPRIAPVTSTLTVGAGYFATLGVPTVEGRELEPRDGRDGRDVIVVNQRFVDLHLPEGGAIGQRVRIRRDASAPFSPWMEIVGVTPDLRQTDRLEVHPIVYVPFDVAAPATVALILRSTTPPEALASRLRQEVAAIDSDLPIYRVMPMPDAIAEATYTNRVGPQLLSIITAIAMGLAGLGLYAVIAHSVNQRAVEIGVRMALGARAGQVRSLVLGRAARQTAIGLVVGILGAIAWNRFIYSGSWTTSGIETGTLAVVLPIVAAVAVVASAIPAYRATRVDPATALRGE